MDGKIKRKTECALWQNKLYDYVDGSLSCADKAALEAHLQVCQTCRKQFSDISRMLSAVRASAPEPERDIGEAVLAKIAAENTECTRSTETIRNAEKYQKTEPVVGKRRQNGVQIWYRIFGAAACLAILTFGAVRLAPYFVNGNQTKSSADFSEADDAEEEYALAGQPQKAEDTDLLKSMTSETATEEDGGTEAENFFVAPTAGDEEIENAESAGNSALDSIGMNMLTDSSGGEATEEISESGSVSDAQMDSSLNTIFSVCAVKIICKNTNMEMLQKLLSSMISADAGASVMQNGILLSSAEKENDVAKKLSDAGISYEVVRVDATNKNTDNETQTYLDAVLIIIGTNESQQN